MKEIKTKEELSEILSNAGEDKLVILKYSATWCGPCQMLANTISQLEENLQDVIFVEADCDSANEDLIEMNHVTNIPRMIYYKDGMVVDDTIGNMSKDALLQKINENKSK